MNNLPTQVKPKVETSDGYKSVYKVISWSRDRWINLKSRTLFFTNSIPNSSASQISGVLLGFIYSSNLTADLSISLGNLKSNGLRLSFPSHSERIIHAVDESSLLFHSPNAHLSQALHQRCGTPFCLFFSIEICVFHFYPCQIVSLIVLNSCLISA